MKNWILMLMIVLVAVGCKSDLEKKAESVVEVVNGYYEELELNATVEVAKVETAQGGQWVVVKVTQTEGTESEVQYWAVDLTHFTVGMTMEEVLELSSNGEFFSTEVVPSAGAANGMFVNEDDYNFGGTDYDAGTVVFETTEATSKDLEKMAAFKEEMKIERVSESLSENFGLSVERSAKVAKMMHAFKKMSTRREVTNADADAFAAEILGVSYDEAHNALKKSAEGDSALLDQVIEDAAAHNQVSPEHMSEILGLIVK